MLSFEEIEDCFPNGAVSLPDGWIGVTAQWMLDLARAIEAAVLPEGWVAVPRIVTPAIEAVYGNDSGAYGTAQELHDAMLAAAPKPAQASPLDLMECLQDRPVEPSKAVQGKCVVQAEKQEPVMRLHITQTGSYPDVQVEVLNGEGFSENGSILLYTRPQPDLTAEVERLKSKEFDWAKLNAKLTDRIAELEAQDTEMCDVHAQLLVEHGKAKLHIAALEEAAREAREKQ